MSKIHENIEPDLAEWIARQRIFFVATAPLSPDDARFAELAAHFPPNPGTHAYGHIALARVCDSCGFSVPYYEHKEPRDTLERWAAGQGPEKIEAYRAKKNQRSIDDLPAFTPGV